MKQANNERIKYPDKAVPFVGGQVERAVVVVVDQLHLVVEAHLEHNDGGGLDDGRLI